MNIVKKNPWTGWSGNPGKFAVKLASHASQRKRNYVTYKFSMPYSSNPVDKKLSLFIPYIRIRVKKLAESSFEKINRSDLRGNLSKQNVDASRRLPYLSKSARR